MQEKKRQRKLVFLSLYGFTRENEFNPNFQSGQENYGRVKRNANIVILCVLFPSNKHQVSYSLSHWKKNEKEALHFSPWTLSSYSESFCRISGFCEFSCSFAVINWSFSHSFIQMILFFLSLLIPKTTHLTILCCKVLIYKNQF